MVLTKALGFYGWKITNKKKEILPGIQEHNYAVDGKVHFFMYNCVVCHFA